MAKPVQEINAGSMADIAFLLLIFFLVTTTMDVDKGLMRKLPPMPQEEKTKQPPIEIKERNIFVVLVNKNDELLVENRFMNVDKLKEEAITFISNPEGLETFPERRMITESFAKEELAKAQVYYASNPNDEKSKEAVKNWENRLNAVKLVGDYWESKQVISLQNDNGTSYGMYIAVQNELVAAYNQLRDDLSMNKFGKKFMHLNKEQSDAVSEVYPQRISEAEPKNIGGK